MANEKSEDKENILAQATNLEGLIDYQKDSVVSKTIQIGRASCRERV